MRTLAKENMSSELITTSTELPLDAAYEKMLEYKIRHLPVVDVTGAVVGIISDRDLQRAMISEVQGAGFFSRETCEFNPEHMVRDYMNWPVKTVKIEDPLRLVTEKMLREKVSAFLVMDGESVAGIITTDDLLAVLEVLLHGQEQPGLRDRVETILANPTLGKIAQVMSDFGI